MAANKRLAKLNSRIPQAFRMISQITDASVGEFAEDVSKMAAQLYRDKIKRPERSTGELVSNVAAVKQGENRHAVVNKTSNDDGGGYGAAQEWGWRRSRGNKKGKKVKGKAAIVRATFGMVKRWQRGERWRD